MSDDYLDPRLAERITRAARAAQALSETLWEALLQELADPRSGRVAELSERLGEVAAVIATLAHVDARTHESEESANPRAADSRARGTFVQESGPPESDLPASAARVAPVGYEGRSGMPRAAPVEYEERSGMPRAAPVEYEERSGTPRAASARDGERSEPSAEQQAPPWEPPETGTPPAPLVPAVLIDELTAAGSPPPRAGTTPEVTAPEGTTNEPPHAPPAPPFAGAQRARPDAGVRPREGDPPRKARPQIEIRDERSAEGPAAWIDSIGRRLERHEQDRSPFAVLLVELVDVERLGHAEPAEELSGLIDRVEDALARELRPADSLTRERPGRYWLLAPQTDRPGAQVLIERIARAVRSSVSHRGTPLEVAVGVAVCPEDGQRASELAAHADVGLYAARAAGRSFVG